MSIPDKIYRFRPMNDLLLKELLYQELYMASHSELNDPLDLKGRLDFRINSIEEALNLTRILFEYSFEILDKTLYHFIVNKQDTIKLKIYEQLKSEQHKNYIDQNKASFLISNYLGNNGLHFDFRKFSQFISKKTDQFFKNVHICCFTNFENISNTIMWANYAKNHEGICIEYQTVQQKLPLIYRKNEPIQEFSPFKTFNFENTIYDLKIHITEYVKTLEYLRFYELERLFTNTSHPDVKNLNKKWVHKYANEIVNHYCQKTIPWKDEKEFRIIDVSFDYDMKKFGSNILHYPIEIVSGIYFGVKSTNDTIEKIISIFKDQKTKFYQMSFDENGILTPNEIYV